MNSPVTIDASVFVSAFTPTEPAHFASKTLMMGIREQSIPIIVPVLVLPEISAALSRGQGKPELGKAFVQELKNFPNTTFVDVDEAVADLAVEIAANHRLRGSDAVCGGRLAVRHGTDHAGQGTIGAVTRSVACAKAGINTRYLHPLALNNTSNS